MNTFRRVAATQVHAHHVAGGNAKDIELGHGQLADRLVREQVGGEKKKKKRKH